MGQTWTIGDVFWLWVLLVFWLVFSHLAKQERARTHRKPPGPRPRRRTWREMCRHMAIWWVVVLGLVPTLAFAQTDTAYITADPGRADHVGLATVDGRYSVALGAGCDDVVPGAQVVMDDTDHLQVVDPIQGLRPSVCEVAGSVQMSDVPCAQGPDGQCDVGHA